MPPKQLKKTASGEPKKPSPTPTAKRNESEILNRELMGLELSKTKERLERMTAKVDELTRQNQELRENMSRQDVDQKDVYEYLHTQLRHKDEDLASMEEKVLEIEKSRDSIQTKLETQLNVQRLLGEDTTNKLKTALASCQVELDDLNEFKERKAEIEEEVVALRQTIADQKKVHSLKVSELDRKVVTEKEKLNKQMLQKVKEANDDLLRIADSQLEETTKRTILENEALSSELAFTEREVAQLLARNKQLETERGHWKRKVSLLQSAEAELARRSLASQQAVQVLVEKLSIAENEIQSRVNAESKENADIVSRYEQILSDKNNELQMTLDQLRSRTVEKDELLKAQAVLSTRAENNNDLESEDGNDLVTFLSSALYDARKQLAEEGLTEEHGEWMDGDEILPSIEDMSTPDRSRILNFLLNHIAALQAQDGQRLDSETMTATEPSVSRTSRHLLLLTPPPLPPISNPSNLHSIGVQTDSQSMGQYVPIELAADTRPWGRRAKDLPSTTSSNPQFFLKRGGGVKRGALPKEI